MTDKKMVIEEVASCPFIFQYNHDVWRCSARYFWARTNPTKDKCLPRYCPLRKGKVIVEGEFEEEQK